MDSHFNKHASSNFDSIADSHAATDAYFYVHFDRYGYTFANVNSNCEFHPHADIHAYKHRGFYSIVDFNADRFSYAFGDSNKYTNSYSVEDPYQDVHAFAHLNSKSRV